ncbi:hypothetical protein F2Q69_00034313 [Brassica cretica]|uniref:Uncharacterized protein n=1 Tax=Brassica cretica TaxID=69181 RepID=A0A8S9SCY1_BRACR|nr:hypothetical protein F2Q69_00034313 [Brassica cretica]
MNKHLVENFLAFRNSHRLSRDAKDDQEDSPGDEVLVTDQGARGRMGFSKRYSEEVQRRVMYPICCVIRPKNGTLSRYGFDKNSEGRMDGSLGLTKGAERPSIFPCLIVA